MSLKTDTYQRMLTAASELLEVITDCYESAPEESRKAVRELTDTIMRAVHEDEMLDLLDSFRVRNTRSNYELRKNPPPIDCLRPWRGVRKF